MAPPLTKNQEISLLAILADRKPRLEIAMSIISKLRNPRMIEIAKDLCGLKSSKKKSVQKAVTGLRKWTAACRTIHAPKKVKS